MKSPTPNTIFRALLLCAAFAATTAAAANAKNAILFVADGLRAGSVNPTDAPTLWRLSRQGVRFANSHSLFPTVTTANAAAIALGRAPADTGDYNNNLYLPGVPGLPSLTPSLEDDRVLTNLQARGGSSYYLPHPSLLQCAREAGCATAVIGKIGPVLIQDITQSAADSQTIVLDDASGSANGLPLNKLLLTHLGDALGKSTLALALARGPNGVKGNNQSPGTRVANVHQQQFFVDTLTKVVLPLFQSARRPFVIIYWSRDPDGTQHFEGDSLNEIDDGINGATSRAGVRNCDANLAQIANALRDLGLEASTDLFITSDHGFDTLSQHEVSADGPRRTMTQSYAAGLNYFDAIGRREVNTGWLPHGFLAIDLAHALQTNLFDPDKRGANGPAPVDYAKGRRPSNGNGIIGWDGGAISGAEAVVTANGGSDLIYLPGDLDPEHPRTNTALARRLVEALIAQDYVSGIFIDDKYCARGEFPGALPLSRINLADADPRWSAGAPRPALIVNFASFTTDPGDPLQHGVVVADTDLQEGQGNHGGFDRAATFNFMAACGPDFRTHYEDPAPAGNADIAVTLEFLLFGQQPQGALAGRVLDEALADTLRRRPELPPDAVQPPTWEYSAPGPKDIRTILRVQTFDGHRYFDAAGFSGRTLGLGK